MDHNIFEVGRNVSIETDYKYYLTARLIGWERNLFLIVSLTHTGGKREQLKVHDACKIRFLKDGVAYGFESTILASILHPYPVIFLQYPKTIEQFTIRKFHRVKSDLHARLLDENGRHISNATITNISVGGCGVRISLPEGKNLSYQNSYNIDFSILETNLHLFCIIRKIRNERDACCLGLEFFNISAEDREKINLFLDVGTNILTSRADELLSRLKTSGESLGGHIDELSLSDIFQIFDQSKKEGVLNISGGECKGYVTFGKGQVMDASMDQLHAEDAMVEFLSLKEGVFHFYPKETSPGRINKPISFILMDICRLMDEKEEMGQWCPTPHETLVLAKAPDTEDTEIRIILDAFRKGASSLKEISEETGLSLIRATLATANLLKYGFVTKSL